MNPHDWFVDNRTAFATRALDPADERTFREHLAGCETCRNEVARIERDLTWLPMGVNPVPPRPGLTRELVDAALGGRRAFGWLLPVLAAAAALALVVAAAAWSRGRERAARLEVAASTLEQRLAAVEDTLSIIRGAAKVAHVSIRMDGRDCGLIIFADERTHRWNVVVHGLPPAHPGEVYQFWFITETGMVRGVQLHPDLGGPLLLTLPMPPGGGVVRGAALTMEAMTDSTTAPKGVELAHLIL